MLMSHVQETMKPAELAAHLGLSSQYVRTACHRAKTPSTAPGLLDVKQQHQRDGKLACHEAVQEIITDFFVQETCIFSGQNNNLWRLLKQKKELRFRFVASYPQLLRDKAVNLPELLAPTSPLTKVYTKLQASTLAARWAAQQVGFDEQQEHDTRRAEAEAADLEERVAKRLARLGIRAKALKARASPSASVDLSVAVFDASTYQITAPAEETFWKVLEHHKVRYSQVHNPTQCPIHDAGPEQELTLPLVVAELAALALEEGNRKNTARRAKLVGEVRELRAQVLLYRQHMEQYQTQRRKIQKLEAELKPGEGVLYRDFVNDHHETGAKVCNLQLVLVERKVLGGPLVLTNLENFADTEACDAWFTADVFQFHLSPGAEHHPGLLDHLHTLYICGDHGPHFSSNKTVFNESTFFRRFGKTVHCIFLCSYHAYNRCDAAGVVPKRLSAQLKREGRGPVGAAAYARMVNASPYSNHVSFVFPRVNRGLNVFPEE